MGRTPLRVRHVRFMTRWVIVIERLWPALLPFLIVASVFVSLSWLGVFRLLGDMPRLVLGALFLIAAVLSLLPLRRFRTPTPAETDRRIEQANRLEHTPLLVQDEPLEGDGDVFANALWQEHRRRMAARLEQLSADTPRPAVPERDPWGLRSLAALLLVFAFAFSFSPRAGRIGDVFRVHISRDAIPPRIDAWITPPAYTGQAPLFLTAENAPPDQRLSVPENSRLTLRITGGSGEEKLAFKGHDGKTHAIEAKADKSQAVQPGTSSARQFTDALNASGAFSLTSDGREINHWAVSVIPDKPPVIHFAGEPKEAANGTLELAYTIEDDYGVTAAKADIEQVAKPAPGAHPLYKAPDLPLVLPSPGARNHAARTSKDLTDHPWAGTPVRITLEATDAAGHVAHSGTKTFILPERPFTNPLARAIVEQRRILALDANQKGHVLDMMDAITLRPEDTFPNMGQYLAIVSARSSLKMAASDDAYRHVVDYLWQIALGIEDGNLSDAQKRLRQAEQALQQAIDRGASDQEIDRLMSQLRKAMQDYLREFAERAQKNPNLAQQMPQNGQEIRPGDLQRMLDQIQNLAKSGSRDKAQQLLSELQNMMNNLQARRGGQQQGQMRKQMDQLGDLMRRQQEMMNKTFNLGQQQQNGDDGEMGGQQQPGQNGQQGQGMTPDQLAQALRQLQQGQGKLQKELQGLMKSLNNMGIKPGQGFGEAGEAMGRAGKALGQAEGGEAAGEQGNALQALRRGAQDMMRQMQQALQGRQGGSGQGGRDQNAADRDPLGRPRATNGPDFGESVKVPDQIDVQRARRILEEIRRRLGDALSPDLEKSYLERLLNMQ